MKKYILLYQGFGKTDDGMDAWGKWFESVGDKFVDSGNPFGEGKVVTKSGTNDLAQDDDAISGYSIVNAESLEAAVEIAKGAPITSGVRVYEAAPM